MSKKASKHQVMTQISIEDILKGMIEAGATVPLNLTLFDGNKDMKVLARVLSPDLKLLEEVELLHVEGGVYVNRSVLMPELPYLIAHYSVFDGDKESEEYEKSSDVFYLSPKQPDVAGTMRTLMEEYVPKQEQDYMVSQVSEEFPSDDFLEGKVTENDPAKTED